MNFRCKPLPLVVVALLATTTLLFLTCCTKKSTAQISGAVDLHLDVKTPFRFVAYGDTRFHDPKDIEAANPPVRVALVNAIAEASPAFLCFTGDIVYNGYDENDWKVWDSETSVLRKKKIKIYPALGNHDLHGDPTVALANYFKRFPDLNNSRYYSVRAANTLILVLDSSLDELGGPQGQWLADKLDQVPSDVDFVFLVFHHPPYTSSSDEKKFGGGHSARTPEQALAKTLEGNGSPMLVSAWSCSMGTSTITSATSMGASRTLFREVEPLTLTRSSEIQTIPSKAKR